VQYQIGAGENGNRHRVTWIIQGIRCISTSKVRFERKRIKIIIIPKLTRPAREPVVGGSWVRPCIRPTVRIPTSGRSGRSLLQTKTCNRLLPPVRQASKPEPCCQSKTRGSYPRERLFVHGHCKSFRLDLGLSWHHQTDRLSHRPQNNTRSGARLELRSFDGEFGGLGVRKRAGRSQ